MHKNVSMEIRLVGVTNGFVALRPEANNGNAGTIVGLFVHLDMGTEVNGEVSLRGDFSASIVFAGEAGVTRDMSNQSASGSM